MKSPGRGNTWPGLAFAVGDRWLQAKLKATRPNPLYPSLSGCCVTAWAWWKQPPRPTAAVMTIAQTI